MPPSRLSGGAICRWAHDQDSAVDLPDRRHGIDAPQPSSHRVSGVHMGLRPHTAESRAPRPYHSVALLAPHGEVIHCRLESGAQDRRSSHRDLLAALLVSRFAAVAAVGQRDRRAGRHGHRDGELASAWNHHDAARRLHPFLQQRAAPARRVVSQQPQMRRRHLKSQKFHEDQGFRSIEVVEYVRHLR